MILFQATQGTYFPLERYKATISVDRRPGDAVLRVYALRSYIDNCTLTTYSISAISNIASPTNGHTFKINDTGWVYLLTDGGSLKNSGER